MEGAEKNYVNQTGAIVLFWSEPFSSVRRMSNTKMYKYDWVWKSQIKQDTLNIKRR